MTRFLTTGAALLLTTSIAHAGGIDRSGQSITAIFEDGDYAEFSFGMVKPEVSGEVGPFDLGNIANDYTSLGFAIKTDINDQLSLGLIIDQPYGADVEYTSGPPAGAGASVDSTGITALARYKLNERFSVHGGVRVVSAEGAFSAAGGGYQSTYSSGSASGYVAGAAYEIPDIALRVALTYSSALDFELDGSAGDLTTTMPESINLDFQTGIAADTLLFGSIRYAAWDGVALNDSIVGDLVAYTDDVITYNIGVGRRLSDQLAVSASIGHEKSTGELTGNLGPTDGFTSLSIGAAYTMDTGVELSGGVRFVKVGDATTTSGFEFADNSVVGVGFKVGYNF